MLTEVLVDADAQAQAHLEAEHARLEEELMEMNASIDFDPAVNQGFFVNDLQSNRKCIRDAVFGCGKDYGTLILVMVLLITVYRMPAFVSELYSRVASGRRDRPLTKVRHFYRLHCLQACDNPPAAMPLLHKCFVTHVLCCEDVD